MDKAMEAAARALMPHLRFYGDGDGYAVTIAGKTIKAFLAALKEDPEVVERVAKEVARATIGCDTESADNGMVVSVWIHNPAEVARAALSALEVE